MNKDILQARIDATVALIDAYEAALLALAGGAQEYSLDTGQSVQRVTKFDLKNMNDMLDVLYNRCATLEARLNGGNTNIVRPCF